MRRHVYQLNVHFVSTASRGKSAPEVNINLLQVTERLELLQLQIFAGAFDNVFLFQGDKRQRSTYGEGGTAENRCA